MKVKISKNSVINLHFVTDFVDTVKSVTTDAKYPDKGEYKGDSHIANCKLGVITVKKSNLKDASASFDDSINAQLNVEQYSSGTKNPSNTDIKDNVMYDEKTLKSAIDSELDINSPRAQDIKREEQFLGADSGTEENVDSEKNNPGYTKVTELDVSTMSDIKTRCKNNGIEIEISDVADENNNDTVEKKEDNDDKKDDNVEDNDSYN